MCREVESIDAIFLGTMRIICKKEKRIHTNMCVYVGVCVIFFIVNPGMAVLRKIMIYFIPDKRILSTSCQVLEA